MFRERLIFYISGKEQWIGLNNIYALTNQDGIDMQLRISMEKFSKEKATAFYDNFFLEDRVRYGNLLIVQNKACGVCSHDSSNSLQL